MSLFPAYRNEEPPTGKAPEDATGQSSRSWLQMSSFKEVSTRAGSASDSSPRRGSSSSSRSRSPLSSSRRRRHHSEERSRTSQRRPRSRRSTDESSESGSRRSERKAISRRRKKSRDRRRSTSRRRSSSRSRSGTRSRSRERVRRTSRAGRKTATTTRNKTRHRHRRSKSREKLKNEPPEGGSSVVQCLQQSRSSFQLDRRGDKSLHSCSSSSLPIGSIVFKTRVKQAMELGSTHSRNWDKDSSKGLRFFHKSCVKAFARGDVINMSTDNVSGPSGKTVLTVYNLLCSVGSLTTYLTLNQIMFSRIAGSKSVDVIKLSSASVSDPEANPLGIYDKATSAYLSGSAPKSSGVEVGTANVLFQYLYRTWKYVFKNGCNLNSGKHCCCLYQNFSISCRIQNPSSYIMFKRGPKNITNA